MGKRYETEKKIWGGDRHSEEFKSSSPQVGNLKKRSKTGEKIANEYGVGEAVFIRGKRYEREKKIWGGDRGNQYSREASYQIDTLANLL